MATESRHSRPGRVRDALFRPVDAASLAAFRIAFGGLMLVLVARYFAHGWIEELYLRPQYFFSYPGLEWITPWPGGGMYVHFAVLALAALGMMLGGFGAHSAFYGACSRLSAAVFCLGFTYAHLIDRTNYLNHYYLISLLSFLLVFVPAGRVASVDAARGATRSTVPAWSVWILRFQLVVVYFFAGLAKVDHDWLFEAQPLRAWLGHREAMPILGPLLATTTAAYAFSWAGALFDLSAPFLLLWKRTRLAAYLVAIVFHAMTSLLFPTIGIFPWLMIALTPIFFAPSWPRRWGLRPAPADPLHSHGGLKPTAIGRAAVLAGLTLYAAVQIAVPLRFLLEPGDVLWHERGFRFGWRVMLMEKYGHTELIAFDPDSGRQWRVRPETDLTPLQTYMMSTQPDMIASFAHWTGERLRAEGYERVEIRADAQVSLNGHPHAALIDPRQNLLAAAADL